VLTHWSGHKSRLDRDLKNRFGSQTYAAEELIAELGAAFLCAEFGFDGDVRNAGYIATWIELLKADKREFFTACSTSFEMVFCGMSRAVTVGNSIRLASEVELGDALG
jgi:antirestriction protein ArdC